MYTRTYIFFYFGSLEIVDCYCLLWVRYFKKKMRHILVFVGIEDLGFFYYFSGENKTTPQYIYFDIRVKLFQ